MGYTYTVAFTDRIYEFFKLFFQVSAKSDQAFIKLGFGNWKKSEVLAKHQKSDCHKQSLQAYRYWKHQKPVDHQISEEAEQQESYRQQTVSSHSVIIYLVPNFHFLQ